MLLSMLATDEVESVRVGEHIVSCRVGTDNVQALAAYLVPVTRMQLGGTR